MVYTDSNTLIKQDTLWTKEIIEQVLDGEWISGKSTNWKA